MRIGELAQRTGLGVETVRFYERERLLTEPARGADGYRRGDIRRCPIISALAADRPPAD